MSLVFGPKKLGIGITSPSQVTVEEMINGLPSGDPVDFTTPVTVTSNGIMFEVAKAGQYRVTAKNAYAFESTVVSLFPILPYGPDIQSKVDYLISKGAEGGAVSSVNGQSGVVVLTAGDVSARPASWVPTAEDISDLNSAVESIVDGMDIPGDVLSVNGQTGTVSLNATDVGARADDWSPDLSSYATTSALTTGLGGKANTSHTHTTSQITSFDEAVQDIIGATIVQGSNVTVDYDDAAGTVTISSTAAGGGDVESVNGQTGEVVLNSSNIDVVFGGTTIGQLNDSLQSITESVTGLDSTKLNTPTGTASATTYAAGDGTWKTPPNTTYNVVTQANIENPASTTSGLVTGQRLAQGLAANNVVTGDGISDIVALTQTAYDALPTKDATTFYVILEG